MAEITSATLRTLKLPLHQPYVLSYRTFTSFEPILLELTDSNGKVHFSEGHVSPGSSAETREGAWQHCVALLESVSFSDPYSAKKKFWESKYEHNVASTVLIAAIESFIGSSWLEVKKNCSLSLVAPVNSMEREALELELEELIELGYKTVKVKVGQDVQRDVARVNVISEILGDRALIRVDANRAYTPNDAIQFISKVNGSNIQLFEQPCDSDDWDANAAVAKKSTVPIMLDEPICTLEDIERAAKIQNVGFCKVKLKRFGGVGSLVEGIQLIQSSGMKAVLGDGLGCDVSNWMEAAVASQLITLDGEFNGFLKHKSKLFMNPINFKGGEVLLPEGYQPVLDYDVIESVTTKKKSFYY